MLIDYKEVPVDESLVQDFLKTKSASWNQAHDIKIYGFDVELYVQDITEKHTSTGVYSILNNECSGCFSFATLLIIKSAFENVPQLFIC